MVEGSLLLVELLTHVASKRFYFRVNYFGRFESSNLVRIIQKNWNILKTGDY